VRVEIVHRRDEALGLAVAEGQVVDVDGDLLPMGVHGLQVPARALLAAPLAEQAEAAEGVQLEVRDPRDREHQQEGEHPAPSARADLCFANVHRGP
jgi:hypothetical protein